VRIWKSGNVSRQNPGRWKSKTVSDETVSLIIAPKKRNYAAFAARAEPWQFKRHGNHPESVRLSRFIRLTACAMFFPDVRTIFFDQTTIAEYLLAWSTIYVTDSFFADFTITNQNCNPYGIAHH
jgi:hypothetical protein